MITILFFITVNENLFKITTKLLQKTKDTCTYLVFIKWVSVAI